MINNYPIHYYECPFCHEKHEEYTQAQECINSHPKIVIANVSGWDNHQNLPGYIYMNIGGKKVLYTYHHVVREAKTDDLPSKAELSE